MNKDKQDFIHYTKQVWQPYYQEKLSNNDVIEIIDNMTAFLNLLIEWDRSEQKQKSCKISNKKKIGEI